MPTPFVQKLADKHHMSVPDAENRWAEAKDSADKEGKGENYGYITQIFKRKMGETSAIRSFVNRIRAFDKSKSIPEDQILHILLEDLTKALGPLGLKHKIASKVPSVVYVGAASKANAVKSALKAMDFSIVHITTSGYVGGSRMELESGRATVVNYCSYSGVLVISSTLAFP